MKVAVVLALILLLKYQFIPCCVTQFGKADAGQMDISGQEIGVDMREQWVHSPGGMLGLHP